MLYVHTTLDGTQAKNEMFCGSFLLKNLINTSYFVFLLTLQGG